MVDSKGIDSLEKTEKDILRNFMIETNGATKIHAIVLVFKATDYNR